MIFKCLPSFNGDCIFLTFESNGVHKNILIDGGTPRTYRRFLKPEIERIINSKQEIDLLIITHIDDDHIGGIKELFQDSTLEKSFLKSVWFNSGNLLYNYFDSSKETTREVEIIPDDTNEMSVKQGISLENALIKEKSWIQKLIFVGNYCHNLPDAKIHILSPNEEQLLKLHKAWEIEVDRTTEMSGGLHSDYNLSIAELINKQFNEDKSIPNGSSIAFLFEAEGKKILLLGDSHPSVIETSLRNLGYSEKNKLVADLVKVSHHASKANTSPSLLSIINCNKFVISTDGSKHGLPNKEPIARIISFNKGCKIYFNYDDVFFYMFLETDFKNFDFQCLKLSESDYSITL